MRAKSIRILSESETPPFPIEADSKTKEELRLKYRYLDLRRPDLQRNLMMKSKVMTLVRQFLADEGFLEIETPILQKSTPASPSVFMKKEMIQSIWRMAALYVNVWASPISHTMFVAPSEIGRAHV